MREHRVYFTVVRLQVLGCMRRSCIALWHASSMMLRREPVLVCASACFATALSVSAAVQLSAAGAEGALALCGDVVRERRFAGTGL